ncbi:hypothetical protein GCM10010191_00540 [Actinomadura vinacea]|uniref:Uncharacterized protein n=1 Tax=Actinomadura vinacea TaxID=115336 RepID=A0ABP5VAC8_9ACTN
MKARSVHPTAAPQRGQVRQGDIQGDDEGEASTAVREGWGRSTPTVVPLWGGLAQSLDLILRRNLVT